jgi:soluble epoxide hydrolase/lipid-phosphate phosphatase
MPAIANAGFRAIAPDMRGYGETDAPPNIDDYTQEKICGDLVNLLDAMGYDKAVFVGHDWGGAVVWNMATHYPERVRAVAGVNTPFSPPAPVSFTEAMKQQPDAGVWDYQLYFQEPGVAEQELGSNVERTMKLVMRSSDPDDNFGFVDRTEGVRARGGLLVGMPDDPPRSKMLDEEELRAYVDAFSKTGFRGGLNWYRNHDANWEWSQQVKDRKVEQPALMVTAGKDAVLTPALSEGMEQWVPNLTRGHIEQCGHWTQQERPEELNTILVNWLTSLP